MTDLEIARSVTPQPIGRIAEKLGLNPESLEPYGKTKAKIPLEALREPQGQLVLVTAILLMDIAQQLLVALVMLQATIFLL